MPRRNSASPAIRSLALGPGIWTAAAVLVLLQLGPASAGDVFPFAARAGLEVAADAARTWAPDAALIYVENDEDLDAWGAAERWGYLYYSPTLDRARVYSVEEGKILVAENLDMKFVAPPLSLGWINSGTALAAAEQQGGRKFRDENGGRVSTMLLMRGAFHDADPDQTTWTVIYTAPGAPSLFVVVDAAGGKVRRTWRG